MLFALDAPDNAPMRVRAFSNLGLHAALTRGSTRGEGAIGAVNGARYLLGGSAAFCKILWVLSRREERVWAVISDDALSRRKTVPAAKMCARTTHMHIDSLAGHPAPAPFACVSDKLLFESYCLQLRKCPLYMIAVTRVKCLSRVAPCRKA